MPRIRKIQNLQLDLDRNLVQHNDLINSNYSMTLVQMRMFLYMLYETDSQQETDFKEIQIPIRFFEEASQRAGMTLYQCIEQNCDEFLNLTIKIASLKRSNKYHSISLISYCKYENGVVSARFNQDVKPYLLQLKSNFTSKSLREILYLQNPYSHRIYDLLKQYENLSRFNDKTYFERYFTVDELRQRLECTDKYLRYTDFKRYVLEKVQSDLANTSMAFELYELRKSNRVQQITFRVYRQESNVPQSNESGSENKPAPVTQGDQLTKEGWEQFVAQLPEDSKGNPEKIIARLLKLGLTYRQIKSLLERTQDYSLLHRTAYQVHLDRLDNKINNAPAVYMKVIKDSILQ